MLDDPAGEHAVPLLCFFAQIFVAILMAHIATTMGLLLIDVVKARRKLLDINIGTHFNSSSAWSGPRLGFLVEELVDSELAGACPCPGHYFLPLRISLLAFRFCWP